VVSKKMVVFWVVVTCSVADVYQHFQGAYCLEHLYTSNRLHGTTTQKTAIFNSYIVRLQFKIGINFTNV
jgi:hypothetical protein